MCTITPLIYILFILISIFIYIFLLCGTMGSLFWVSSVSWITLLVLTSQHLVFKDKNKTIDPLFARTSLPVNTFARGYQLPLLWSWICCETGSKLSAEQVPQHAVSFGAKVLFKIVLGQYLTLWDEMPVAAFVWILNMFVWPEVCGLFHHFWTSWPL